MTKLERLKIYEGFFHTINMYRTCMDTKKIASAIELIDSWSYAHRVGNGEYTDREQKGIVERIIKKMAEF